MSKYNLDFINCYVLIYLNSISEIVKIIILLCFWVHMAFFLHSIYTSLQYDADQCLSSGVLLVRRRCTLGLVPVYVYHDSAAKNNLLVLHRTSVQSHAYTVGCGVAVLTFVRVHRVVHGSDGPAGRVGSELWIFGFLLIISWYLNQYEFSNTTFGLIDFLIYNNFNI